MLKYVFTSVVAVTWGDWHGKNISQTTHMMQLHLYKVCIVSVLGEMLFPCQLASITATTDMNAYRKLWLLGAPCY